MTGGFWLGAVGACVLIAAIVEMVRRRYIRGKFAVTWLAVALVAIVLTLAPGLLELLASATGVAVPLNLLLFVGFVGLALIIIQLTAAHGRLERQVTELAERLALATAREGHERPDTPTERQHQA